VTSHRDIDERFSAGTQPLVVLAHPPVLREPRESALHHPPPRQYHEAIFDCDFVWCDRDSDEDDWNGYHDNFGFDNCELEWSDVFEEWEIEC
jgi:hypothetical protein